jgi:hypothetical protein
VKLLSRYIGRAHGQHRPRQPELLPDEPIYPTTVPVPHAIRDEAHLEQLLDGGQVAANAFATCPAEKRSTFHAFDQNGMRRCWTCGETSAGDAIRPASAVEREAS